MPLVGSARAPRGIASSPSGWPGQICPLLDWGSEAWTGPIGWEQDRILVGRCKGTEQIWEQPQRTGSVHGGEGGLCPWEGGQGLWDKVCWPCQLARTRVLEDALYVNSGTIGSRSGVGYTPYVSTVCMDIVQTRSEAWLTVRVVNSY